MVAKMKTKARKIKKSNAVGYGTLGRSDLDSNLQSQRKPPRLAIIMESNHAIHQYPIPRPAYPRKQMVRTVVTPGKQIGIFSFTIPRSRLRPAVSQTQAYPVKRDPLLLLY